MSCNHTSTSIGRAFCNECGMPVDHRRCVCGNICAALDRFCSVCGFPLKEIDAVVQSGKGKRFDLEKITKVANFEAALSEAHKARVSQDDIKKLLARRRKTRK